jgi:pyruvate carboxylase
MLVKLICRGRTFEAAVARARRALAEFRIRGVSTNIPFLQAVLEDPEFVAGNVSTAFIEQRPELLTTHAPADRGTRLLRWLAEVTINKPYGDPPTLLDPGVKRPAGVDLSKPSPKGSASGCSISGRRDLRPTPVPYRVEVTDTTFRTPPVATAAWVRTKDLLRIAPYVGRDTTIAVRRVLGARL